MIKYLGSKRLLLPRILRAAEALGAQSALDAFSGTSRVGHALKGAGLRVHANDELEYAAALGRCYVAADADSWTAPAEALIARLSELSPEPGYFTRTFCEDARFFQPKNGARIDAIRMELAGMEERGELPEPLRSILLVSLMEAADRVDSTTGVQMAYLKKWAKRSNNDLALRLPALLPGEGIATRLDATEAVRRHSHEVDLVYLDPPYNQHKYVGNYHVWETLVRWDAPEAYGIARKRIDCKERKSDYNSKRRIHAALRELIEAVESPHLLVSFSNEGFVEQAEIEEMLRSKGDVGVVAVDFKRYVGAQIGVYNPSGKRVGSPTHLRNKELLFVVSQSAAATRAAVDALHAAPSGG